MGASDFLNKMLGKESDDPEVNMNVNDEQPVTVEGEAQNIVVNFTGGEKSSKLENIANSSDENSAMSFNQYETGFVDNEEGFTFDYKNPTELDKERVEKFGLTLAQMQQRLNEQKAKDLQMLSENIGEDYIDAATTDCIMIYNKLASMLPFTAPTNRSMINQMASRVERIIASDDKFYEKPIDVRSKKFNQEITSHMTGSILNNFQTFTSAECTSSFGIYNSIYVNIKAQDFILTSNFINVQYDNANFFYIDIPNYLLDINDLLVRHLCVIYAYSKGTKFDPQNAMLDIEDKGFRFNFEHQSIVATRYPVIFARKNVFGVAKLINNPNYYKDLLSNFDKTDEEKDEIIKKMRHQADIGNFLVIGRTGSGKTTLLRQLLLDREKREQNLITIEDTKELNLPNAISYLTNKKYGIHDIFKSTLRMNPSRVIVGETRDATILDILEVCLTSRSATTLHATDMAKAITRIRMMSQERGMSTSDLDFLIVSAIDMFVFIDNRKITSLYIKKSDTYTGSDIFEAYERVL